MDILDKLLADAPAEGDATPDPSRIEAQARQPASVAAVNLAFAHHRETCPAMRWIRRATILLAVVLGALAATQAIALVAGRAIIRDTVREAVRAELGRVGPHHAATAGVFIGSAEAGQ